jgi:hypothetical protein
MGRPVSFLRLNPYTEEGSQKNLTNLRKTDNDKENLPC